MSPQVIPPSQPLPKAAAFQWRALISVVVSLAFLFLAASGIDLATAQARLAARGISASANLTLREIAAQGGYQRPAEIPRIVRGN